MKGTIRIVAGLFIVFGAVGGVEQDTLGLLEGTLWSLVGLAIMGWGAVAAAKEEMA